MPQLDLLSFLSQFFWFSIGFWALYFVVFKYFLIPTAFSLKIREYLSFKKSSSSNTSTQDTQPVLSGNNLSDFDSLSLTYSNFLNRHSDNFYTNLENLFKSTEKNTKSTVYSSTDLASINYVLKKNIFYYEIAKPSSSDKKKKKKSKKSTR